MNVTCRMTLALALASSPAFSNCARCGPDGTRPPGQPAAASFFLTTSPRNPLPDGAGTVSVTLRPRLYDIYTSNGSLRRLQATAVTVDYDLVAPVTFTGLESRQAGSNSVDLGLSLAHPLNLATGKGTRTFQLATTPWIGARTLTLHARTSNRPEGFTLGTLAEASEHVALAGFEGVPDLDGATVALTAAIVRNSAGEIAAAELRYDLRYRSQAGFRPSGLRFRAAGVGGNVVIDAGFLPQGIATTTGGRSIQGRLVPDLGGSALGALEALARNPSFLTAELVGVKSYFARLEAPLRARFAIGSSLLPGTAENPNSKLVGYVDLNFLRSEAGVVRAGLVNLDWIHADVNPGTVFLALRHGEPGSEPVTFDSAPLSPVLGPDGTTAQLNQSLPLLAGEPLLRAVLSPSSFEATVSTARTPAGAFLVKLADELVPVPQPGLAVTSVVPSITTPGSIITIHGLSFPQNPVVLINGVAGTVLYASATQINLLVPPQLESGQASLFVVGRDVVSSRVRLFVDEVEPYVFTDATGPAIVRSGTTDRVRASTPVAAGETIDIYCTGISGTSLPILYTVLGTPVVPRPLAGVPGVWVVTVQVPANLPAGERAITVDARIAQYLFRSNPVPLFIR